MFAALVCGMTAVGTPDLGVSLGGAQTVAIDARSFGRTTEVFQRPVTVHVDHVSLRDAVAAVATSADVVINCRRELLEGSDGTITLNVTKVPLGIVLEQILTGHNLRAVASAPDIVTLTADRGMSARTDGIIRGTVIDTKTKQPVAGATVSLDRATKGIKTPEDGTFQISGVAAGTHTVTVRAIGHGRQAKSVTVADDQSVSVAFEMAGQATPLDNVVVTGTVTPTELKAVPNAITVITAKELEQRGITHIDQLFRGDVPGVFAQRQGSGALLDEVTMYSRGMTAFGYWAGDPGMTNPIKTYVDGVELADPKYLSQIDPKTIERIEILTGPQASTIYGSNAINGVMQVFTKRGTTNRPQLTLNLLTGWVENNFSAARTPQHDDAAQVSGVERQLSYNTGISWNYQGPWTPAKQMARLSGFGGARLELPNVAGRVVGDMSLRRVVTTNRQRGGAEQQLTEYFATGWFPPLFSGGSRVPPTSYSLVAQTLGVTMTYTPSSWWSHEFGIGNDVSDTEVRTTGRGYTYYADTTLSLQQSYNTRQSLRYATTIRVPVPVLGTLVTTTGVDTRKDVVSSLAVSPTTLTGTLFGLTTVTRQPAHNAGGFLQAQLGVMDRLFFTYGLRAEWNPNYGADAEPNLAPRYGVAYSQDLGEVTVKLRGSYGRSTRPPIASEKAALKIDQSMGYGTYGWPYFSARIFPYYGLYDAVLANPNLGPEYQQGGEGGVELYWGTHGSLVVTRFNQTVDGLISGVIVDSVRSSTPCAATYACEFSSRDANGYGYSQQSQYLNVGGIRNQGWEAQANINLGPISTRGTYSLTKSRSLGVDPRYRSFFTESRYQPGATFNFAPEHTWAIGASYSSGPSTLAVNVSGVGLTRVLNDEKLFRLYSPAIRLDMNRAKMDFEGYPSANPAYALVDVAMSHRFVSYAEGVIQVQNLGDRYVNDRSPTYASLGRQVTAGVRLRSR